MITIFQEKERGRKRRKETELRNNHGRWTVCIPYGVLSKPSCLYIRTRLYLISLPVPVGSRKALFNLRY